MTTASVDILGRYDDRRVVVEYDGVFWHAGKAHLDAMKTTALISAGFTVVRIRESHAGRSLPILPLANDQFMQVDYRFGVDDVGATVTQILEYLDGSAWRVNSSAEPPVSPAVPMKDSVLEQLKLFRL